MDFEFIASARFAHCHLVHADLRADRLEDHRAVGGDAVRLGQRRFERAAGRVGARAAAQLHLGAFGDAVPGCRAQPRSARGQPRAHQGQFVGRVRFQCHLRAGAEQGDRVAAATLQRRRVLLRRRLPRRRISDVSDTTYNMTRVCLKYIN